MKFKKSIGKKLRREIEKRVDVMKAGVYEQRIVAFVDILGFKNMVCNSTDSRLEQQKILDAMKLIYRVKELNDSGFDGGLRRYGIQVTTFSDSAVISYPLSHDGGLFYVLMDLIHLQIDLLAIGIFVRGGITVGLAHHDEYNVFGPAMVEAYELESKSAVYPRIILTEETINYGIMNSPSHQNSHDMKLFESLLRKDADGYYYVNYLAQSQEFDYPEIDYYRWMQGVRNCIVSNLNLYCGGESAEVRRVYEKYLWVLDYWNASLEPGNLTYPVEVGRSKKEINEIFESYMKLKINPEVVPYM